VESERGRLRLVELELGRLRLVELEHERLRLEELGHGRLRLVELDGCEEKTHFVVERRLSGLAADEGQFNGYRIGSLRAASQVIRAHVLRYDNDEYWDARITCSVRPC